MMIVMMMIIIYDDSDDDDIGMIMMIVMMMMMITILISVKDIISQLNKRTNIHVSSLHYNYSMEGLLSTWQVWKEIWRLYVL